jgi:hypothetical protein
MSGPVQLTLFSCNKGAMITMVVVLPMMLFTIFVLQLIVYSELYKDSRACYPILYFFGETYGCRQTIARIARNETQTDNIKELIRDRITYQESFYDGIEQTNHIWKISKDMFSNLFTSYISFLHSITNNMQTFRRNIHREFILPTIVKTIPSYYK